MHPQDPQHFSVKLPSSTPVTIEAKLSSSKIISAACLDTSDPVIPMATPSGIRKRMYVLWVSCNAVKSVMYPLCTIHHKVFHVLHICMKVSLASYTTIHDFFPHFQGLPLTATEKWHKIVIQLYGLLLCSQPQEGYAASVHVHTYVCGSKVSKLCSPLIV